jgi:hypothetical protein
MGAPVWRSLGLSEGRLYVLTDIIGPYTINGEDLSI